MDGNFRELGPAWETLRRLAGPSGSAKLAWRYLWVLARGRPATVVAHFTLVGEDQGTSDRAGRRSVANLETWHLVRVIERLPNRWVVDILDPREVCRDRGWADNGQLEIRFPDDNASDGLRRAGSEAGSAVGDAQLRQPSDPAADAGRFRTGSAGGSGADPPSALTSEKPRRSAAPLNKTSTSVVTSDHSKVTRARGHGGSGADPPAEAERLGTLATNRVGHLVDRLPGNEHRADAIESLADRLRQRVRGLRNRPALRVATAIVDGQLPEGEVMAIVGNMERHARDGTLEQEPFAYFVASCRRQFVKRGLFWPEGAEAARADR